MNIKGFIIGALALLAAGTANASQIYEIGNATYKLYDGGAPICSAVAVSPTQLVTAAHCVDSKNLNIQIEKLGPDFKPLAIDVRFLKVTRTFKGKDVALLEIKDGILPQYVEIASPKEVNLKLGDPVIVVGYPKVKEITLTHGEFSSMASLTDMGLEGAFYKVTAPVTGGNSGGGLYGEFIDEVTNEKEYRLIGLTTGSFRDVSFLNYFSTVDSLDLLLKNMLNIKGDPIKTEAINPNLPVNPADLR